MTLRRLEDHNLTSNSASFQY